MLVSRTIVSFPLHTQTLSKYKELVISNFIDNLHIFVYWAACPCCSCSVSKSARGLAIKDPWPLLFPLGKQANREAYFVLKTVQCCHFVSIPNYYCTAIVWQKIEFVSSSSSAGKCPSWVKLTAVIREQNINWALFMDKVIDFLHWQDNRFSSLSQF